MNIKIEFPSDRADLALAFGQALTAIGTGKALINWRSNADGQALATHEQSASTTAFDDQFTEGPKQNTAQSATATTGSGNTSASAGGDSADPKQNTVQSATATTGSGNTSASAGGASAKTEADTERVDKNGVVFNPDFCAVAQEPFYTSGKREGQWKKRRAVSDDAYDEWYAGERFGSQIVEEAETSAEQVFGKPVLEADESIPQDAGELMQYVSEQQAAGALTQQDVTDAYFSLGLGFDAIMNPAGDIAENCRKIYLRLKEVAQNG